MRQNACPGAGMTMHSCHISIHHRSGPRIPMRPCIRCISPNSSRPPSTAVPTRPNSSLTLSTASRQADRARSSPYCPASPTAAPRRALPRSPAARPPPGVQLHLRERPPSLLDVPVQSGRHLGPGPDAPRQPAHRPSASAEDAEREAQADDQRAGVGLWQQLAHPPSRVLAEPLELARGQLLDLPALALQPPRPPPPPPSPARRHAPPA